MPLKWWCECMVNCLKAYFFAVYGLFRTQEGKVLNPDVNVQKMAEKRYIRIFGYKNEGMEYNNKNPSLQHVARRDS